jgi:hypothetical protein
MRGPLPLARALWIPLLLVLGCASSLPGCQNAPMLQGQPALNADRELEAHLNADLLSVHEAARRVLVETYQYRIFVDRHDAREGLIRARTPDEGLVRVETYYERPRRTRIQIFVSPSGNEERQREILTEIERNL